MKPFMQYMLSILSLAVIFTACRQDDASSGSGSKGYLLLSVKENLTAETPVLISKSSTLDLDYTVDIINSNGDVVISFDYNDMPDDPIALTYGDYTVRVYNGVEGEADFDKPFYAGEKKVTIKRKQETALEVTTQLANVKVTVDFTDKIRESFSDYYVEVGNAFVDMDNKYVLKYGPDNEGAEGYFRCTGRLYYTIHLVNAQDQSITYTIPKRITDVEPRQHYNIQLTISDDIQGGNNGALGYLMIYLNDEWNERKTVIEVPLSNDKTPPTITEENGLQQETEMNLKSGYPTPLAFEIKSLGTLSKLQLIHNSSSLESILPRVTDLLDPDDENALRSIGLNWTIEGNLQSAFLDMEGFTEHIPDGKINFELVVEDVLKQREFFSWKMNVTSLDANHTQADAFAKFAYLEGEWYGEIPQGLGFEYWKVDAPDDIFKVTDVKYRREHSKKSDDNVYWIIVDGLEENTKYEFCAVTDLEPSPSPIAFQTGKTGQIPGMGFDEWHQNGKVWYPYGDNNPVWDSGNKGATTIGNNNPTTGVKDFLAPVNHGTNKMAAKLASTEVMNVFAAGSIYTGKFGGTVLTSGAYFDVGYPFTQRPTKLSGWYNYTSGEINKTKDPYKDLSGKKDHCSIYLVLAKWNKEFTINTSKGIFIEFDDDDIIAYGEMTTDQSSPAGKYLRFSIPLTYKSLDTPTYVAIIAAASAKGDYFTGSTSSILYLDELEFEYDYDEDTLNDLPYPLY